MQKNAQDKRRGMVRVFREGSKNEKETDINNINEPHT